MPWDESLQPLFEELEQQAEALRLLERDVELLDRSRAAYANVGFMARVHASEGASVELQVRGAGHLRGKVLRAGVDWFLLAEAPSGRESVIAAPAVLVAQGMSARAIDERARPVTARLSLGSALRGLAERREPVSVVLVDGTVSRGTVGRVGADFVELLAPVEPGAAGRMTPAPRAIVFAGIAVVRRG